MTRYEEARERYAVLGSNTEQAMEELASRCAAEAEERLENLLNRFEYALVAFLCLSIGLVLLSVMLPLVGMLSAVGG